jgi:hypothetical protein
MIARGRRGIPWEVFVIVYNKLSSEGYIWKLSEDTANVVTFRGSSFLTVFTDSNTFCLFSHAYVIRNS